MSDIVIDLPDALAKEARDAGLLRSEYVASMFRKEIRRRKINRLFAAADRLSELDTPISEQDLAAEIEAYRKESKER